MTYTEGLEFYLAEAANISVEEFESYYRTCEDAPCCGCCGTSVYGNNEYSEYDDFDFDNDDNDEFEYFLED